MSIENVLEYFQEEKFDKIYEDYNFIRNKICPTENFVVLKKQKEEIGTKNETKCDSKSKVDACSSILLTMAVLNGPTDVDDFFSAYNQILSYVKKDKNTNHLMIIKSRNIRSHSFEKLFCMNT